MRGESKRGLVIANRPAELAKVEDWLAGLMADWGLSARVAYSVDLVVNEVVTNIINYAYRDNASHAIQISLTYRDDSIIVEIADDGTPFDPLAAPAMETGADLEHASVGGWGIQLIKAFSAEQNYAYVSGANRLKLIIENRSRP